MEIIQIVCRDDKIINIPKEEIISISKDDWFISILVTEDYIEKKNNVFRVWEDYDCVMSLLESFRYGCLIVLEGVSLQYLLKLGEKWCVPEWLLKEIENKINTPKFNDKIMEYINYNTIFRCELCFTGFKLCENTKKSCKTHRHTSMCVQNNIFTCCGKNKPDSYCRVGYHVPDKSIDFVYNKTKTLFSVNDENL